MYQDALELLRLTRAETLSMSSGLSQGQVDYQPAPGRWSVGEVLDHLLHSEKLYQDIIARLIELEKDGKRAVISDSFAQVNTSIAYIPKPMLPFIELPLAVFNLFVPTFVREVMTEFRILPAQNPDIARPERGKPLGELRDALRASYEKTAALFTDNPTLDYRRMRYRHPLMGDNHVLEVLRIVAFHERRHQSQMRDVLNLKEFPKAA